MTLKDLNWKLPTLHNDPLVPLESLIFIWDNSLAPFACGICTMHSEDKCKKGNLNNMIIHFQSLKHRLNYFKINFPALYLRLESINLKVDASVLKDDFIKIVRTLCIKVCEHYSQTIADVVKTLNSKFIEVRTKMFLKHSLQSNSHNENMPLVNSLMRVLDDFEDKLILKHNDHSKHQSVETKQSEQQQMDEQDLKMDIKMEKLSSSDRLKTSFKSFIEKLNIYGELLKEITDKIQQKYKEYRQQPDNHHLYEQEWQYFNLKIKRIDPSNRDDIILWENHWLCELFKQESLDYLRAKIDLRMKMNIPLEEEDAKNLSIFEENEKEKVECFQALMKNFNEERTRKQEDVQRKPSAEPSSKRRKCENENDDEKKIQKSPSGPEIPIKLVNVISPECIDEMLQDVKRKLSGTMKTAQSSPQITEMNSADTIDGGYNLLTLEEICFLFSNLENLNDDERSDLFEYIIKMKREDPKKYENLINTNLSDEQARPEVKIKLEEDDDYDDRELIKKVQSNVWDSDDEDDNNDDVVVAREMEIQTIDLTNDSP